MLTFCLSAVACGGGDKSSSDNGDTGDNRGGSGGIPIRGGERIGWDQPVTSPADARGYTFLMYVDGDPKLLSEVSCADERSASGVACSARLPTMPSGRHTLEMTAFTNAGESPRSQPIVVLVGNGVQTSTTGGVGDASASSSSGKARASESGCVATNECYQQRQLASGLGAISAPLSVGDSLFFVENARAVRTIVNDVLQPESALVVGADSRITGLAAAPDFTSTHHVYVAWTEKSSFRETLNITRYRELGGVFAEGATIVTGLPLPVDGLAPIAVDDVGRIYVALPAMQQGIVGPPAELNNYVLRFAADGSIPESNVANSPVLTLGYGRPSGLAWDAASHQVWLSGTDILSAPVTAISVNEMRGEWPSIPLPAANPVSEVPQAMSVTSGLTNAAPRFVWLAGTDGVRRLRIDGSGAPRVFGLTELPSSSLVVDGPGDSLYVFGPMPGDSSFSLMRWDPVPIAIPLRRR